MDDLCFQLKGGMVPMTVLELSHFDQAAFTQQLEEKVEQAPRFFEQMPVIISLEKYTDVELPNFHLIDSVCRKFGMSPVALRGLESLRETAKDLGIAFLPSSQRKVLKPQSTHIEDADIPETNTQAQAAKPTSQAAKPAAEQADVAVAESAESKAEESVLDGNEETNVTPSRIIALPVRSGQRVYAEGDLIILGSVSEGAEVLAEGNIHIYGTLRGRALAGVKGDMTARIFCQTLNAELVSVCGHFKLSEQLKDCEGQSVQVYFDEDTLQVKAL